MHKLAIIGAGDLGRLMAYHAGSQCEVVGFFDDTVKEREVEGHPVLGTLEDVQQSFEHGHFEMLLLAIGYKHMPARQWVFQRFAGRIPFATFVHSSCYVDPSCRLGEGCFLLPGCTLDRNVELGPNVLLNTGCVIAHDTRIGGHSFLAPGVQVAGFVQVGLRCNLGIGTVVIDNLSLVDEVRTGGGTVVVDSLPEAGLYVGVPARRLH